MSLGRENAMCLTLLSRWRKCLWKHTGAPPSLPTEKGAQGLLKLRRESRQKDKLSCSKPARGHSWSLWWWRMGKAPGGELCRLPPKAGVSSLLSPLFHLLLVLAVSLLLLITQEKAVVSLKSCCTGQSCSMSANVFIQTCTQPASQRQAQHSGPRQDLTVTEKQELRKMCWDL